MKRFRERRKNDKTKTRKTLRRAAYQYVLDHSYPTPKGLVVNFFLPQEDEFYRKLEAREYLYYVRVQKEEHFEKYNLWLSNYNRMVRSENYQRMIAKKHFYLAKNGGLYVKCLLKIKAKVNKLLKPYL